MTTEKEHGPYVTSPVVVGPPPSPNRPAPTIVIESDQPVGQPPSMAFTGSEVYPFVAYGLAASVIGIALIQAARKARQRFAYVRS